MAPRSFRNSHTARTAATMRAAKISQSYGIAFLIHTYSRMGRVAFAEPVHDHCLPAACQGGSLVAFGFEPDPKLGYRPGRSLRPGGALPVATRRHSLRHRRRYSAAGAN